MQTNVTSDAGFALIKSFEGFRSTAYRDTGGVLTIGYGHTLNVKPGDRVTTEQAEAFLRDDLATAEKAVNKLVTVALDQNEFDALVSFTFNVGEGAFRDSTLLKHLNNARRVEACGELSRWMYDNKKPLRGLLRRRVAEMDLWINGPTTGRGSFDERSPSEPLDSAGPSSSRPTFLDLLARLAGSIFRRS